MKIVKIALLLISFVGLSLQVQSAPASLSIDQEQKSKVKDKYIRAAHELIKHDLSVDEARFTILNAALNNKGVKWILEQDGDTYLVLRWDYGKEVIFSKVEYDSQFINSSILTQAMILNVSTTLTASVIAIKTKTTMRI